MGFLVKAGSFLSTETLDWVLLGCGLGWLFLFGSSIGSFLNVVVYRLPRGESLSYPPSRCPNCQASISFRDNIPVFGWLLLRGRCRRCREPISTRYPLVELVTGLIVVYAGWLQWVTLQGAITIRGLEDVPWLPVLRFALNALFLITLWTLALLAQDGVTVGKRIAVVVSGIEMVILGFWPALHLGAAWPFGSSGRSLGALLVGLGCLVGIVLGFVAGKLWRTVLVPWAWAMVGVCLGPVTTLWVFLIHLPIGLICALRPSHLVPLPVVAITAILMSVVIQLAMTTLQ